MAAEVASHNCVNMNRLLLLGFFCTFNCAGQVQTQSGASGETDPAYARPLAYRPVIDQQRTHSLSSKQGDTDWKPILWQSGFFLGLEHAFRFTTEPGTRENFRGKFFHDWGDAIRGVNGWGDRDPFIVNYIGHPLQGAVTSYIYTNNHRVGKMAEFGASREYWSTRVKAMAYSAAYSTQFELGPLSEASLGNVGSSAVPGTMGWVDLVVTPTAGMGWQVMEDVLDRYLVRGCESKLRWAPMVIACRGVLNPSRSFSNLMRFKVPWHRDTRPGFRELNLAR